MTQTVTPQALLNALEARYDHHSARVVMAMTLDTAGFAKRDKRLDLATISAALEPHVERGLGHVRERLRAGATAARSRKGKRSGSKTKGRAG